MKSCMINLKFKSPSNSIFLHHFEGVNPLYFENYWRWKWQRTPVFLPGKSHGRKNLVGYSPWGPKELDTTEQLHFTFRDNAGDPSWTPGLGRSPGGEHGSPLQYSFLENSMDRRAWWAAVLGVSKESGMTEWLTFALSETLLPVTARGEVAASI